MIAGIDPGKRGGITILNNSGQIIETYPMMPICDFPYLADVEKCFIEKSQARPNQGVVSMFNYGLHYGEILGLLAAHKIPHVLVSPRTWQPKMLGSKFAKGDSKKAAFLTARKLWPHESFIQTGCRKPHDGIIDSALIAEYGRVYA